MLLSNSNLQSLGIMIPNWLSLGGRTAVVSGSSSGLGRSTALRLARLGCQVICLDLSPQSRSDPSNAHPIGQTPTHELIKANGGASAFLEIDVTQFSHFQNVIDRVITKYARNGRLDIMVNNAGMGGYEEGKEIGGIHLEDPKFAAKVLDVNLMGVWNGTKAAVESMLLQDILPLPCDLDPGPELGDPAASGHLDGFKRGSRGAIINIASIHGMVAGPFERKTCEILYVLTLAAMYSASKSAVINLTRTVAADYADNQINVNSISPGCELCSLSPAR